nr:unnamed protein product [Digitaria exilis]
MGICCSKAKDDDDDEQGGGGFPWMHDDLFHHHLWTTAAASMHTKQGWKGANQDAMTVCQDFAGNKGHIFCGVFDGHGPLGREVARHVRDTLPLKLSSALKPETEEEEPSTDTLKLRTEEDPSSSNTDLDSSDKSDSTSFSDDTIRDEKQLLSTWKNILVKTFEQVDEELRQHSGINCICELARILNCKGRVFAMEDEPDVPRMWLPDQEAPGLAMARAFGDFCLKNNGLICTPEVYYRKLSEKDEFLVLATDGIWDVLSNKEVVKMVSSVKDPSKAARQLIDQAVRAWRRKYPTSMVDDCAVVCLFLNRAASPLPGTAGDVMKAPPHVDDQAAVSSSFTGSFRRVVSGRGGEASSEVWRALEGGVARANSVIRLPRMLSWRRRSNSLEEDQDQQN